MYYINCAHGLVRGVKYYKGEHAIFECTNDIRTARAWTSIKDAKHFLSKRCMFLGHYTIVEPAEYGGYTPNGD